MGAEIKEEKGKKKHTQREVEGWRSDQTKGPITGGFELTIHTLSLQWACITCEKSNPCLYIM